MTRPIQKVVLYSAASKAIRKQIQDQFGDNPALRSSSIVRARSDVTEPTIFKVELDENINQNVIYINSQLYQDLVAKAAKSDNEDLDFDDTGRYDELSDHEQATHEMASKASDLAERLFNRRNGLSSWLFYAYTGFAGLITKDNFKELGNALKNVDFIEKLSQYLMESKNDKGNANEIFNRIFGEKGKERRMANLVLAIKNVSEKLPRMFIDVFPKVFTFINVLTPFAQFLSEGSFLGKALQWVRVANPFIDDFVNSVVGLCGDEMKGIKQFQNREQSAGKIQTSTYGENDTQKVIGEIELREVVKGGRDFQEVRDAVSSAFKRLTRPRNMSGWVLSHMWSWIGCKDYEEFERKHVLNPEFTKAVYDHLQGLPKEGATMRDIVSFNRFDNQHKNYAARIFLEILTLGKNLNEWVINELPKLFGLPYSALYLAAPLLHKVFGEKKGLGKIVDFGLMFLPAINDLFIDVLASAAEEAQFVKATMNGSESKTLFDKLPKGDWKTVKESAAMIWDTIKNFSKKKGTESEQTSIPEGAPA